MGTDRLNPILGTCGPYQNPVIINPYSFATSGGAALTCEFLQSAGNTSDLTEYTFASQNLGSADTNRHIIVTAFTRNGTARTFSSITIGGVTASIVLQVVSADSVAIAIAAVPSGTTGDIVVLFDGSTARCGIDVFRVVGIPTLHDSDSSTSSPMAVNLDVPIGFAIAASCNAGGPTTWAGLTERTDRTIEFPVCSSASDNFATAETGRAISASSSSYNFPAAVFASWS